MSMRYYPSYGLAIMVKPRLILEIFKETLKGNVNKETFSKYFDVNLDYFLKEIGSENPDSLNVNNSKAYEVACDAIDVLLNNGLGFRHDESIVDYYTINRYIKTKDYFEWNESEATHLPHLLIQIPRAFNLLKPEFESVKALRDAAYSEFELMPKTIDILDWLVHFEMTIYG